MDLEEMGKLIASTRRGKGLSQEALASEYGMSRATISGIERGTVPEIGVRKLMALCSTLGLELTLQVKTKRPTLQQLVKEQRDA